MNDLTPNDYPTLLAEIKERIRTAQYAALRAVNKELIALYWDIAQMIVTRQQGETWGKSIVQQLAADLRNEFPGIGGLSASNLWRMKLFYEAYEGNEKLAPLVREIGWTHNLIILERCKDDLQREFYIRMTRKLGWTKNVLIHHIDNQTYEKTLLNQTNFSNREYFIDLLLFHRRLRALVAVELKVGEFLPEFVGKMQFYLAVLDDQVRLPDESPSIGIILCKSKDKTLVEYALRESNKPIGVGTYRIVTELPPELQGQLPAPEQIARLLEEIE
jgi:predicted nuclease of restriction endonuclease-like (RecB) superfamily